MPALPLPALPLPVAAIGPPAAKRVVASFARHGRPRSKGAALPTAAPASWPAAPGGPPAFGARA